MSKALRVDWPACKARGLCAEAFPERIGLDRWGYPLVTSDAIDRQQMHHAEYAVTVCPQQALRLIKQPN